MARFEGTLQEFKRYIGPCLRNVVQQMTKKHKAKVGACEHCGSSEKLESAHVHGRDRTDIIDLLLGTTDWDAEVIVDLQQFEAAFRAEHEPIEKAVLILCEGCHQKYDKKAAKQRRPARSPRLALTKGVLSHATSAFDTMPITLDPPHVGDFKERLLKRKAAEIKTYYGDGRSESRRWDASKFTDTSNVFGNLRSRPEYRQGEWQSRGIVKVHVRVLGDA